MSSEKKHSYRDLGRIFLGNMIAVMHYGHFDIAICAYIQTFGNDVAPDADLHSYRIGLAMLTIFSVADTLIIF